MRQLILGMLVGLCVPALGWAQAALEAPAKGESAPAMMQQQVMGLAVSLGFWMGGWFAGVRAIRALSEYVDKVISKEAKWQAAHWFESRPPNLVLKLAGIFRDAFDSVFGTRHLSWACFWRSCLASYVAAIILSFIWLSLEPTGMKSEHLLLDYGLLLTMVLFVNIWPDYVSLLKTRYVISRFHHGLRPTQLVVWLALDAAATGVISIVGLKLAPFLTIPVLIVLFKVFTLFSETSLVAAILA